MLFRPLSEFRSGGGEGWDVAGPDRESSKYERLQSSGRDDAICRRKTTVLPGPRVTRDKTTAPDARPFPYFEVPSADGGAAQRAAQAHGSHPASPREGELPVRSPSRFQLSDS